MCIQELLTSGRSEKSTDEKEGLVFLFPFQALGLRLVMPSARGTIHVLPPLERNRPAINHVQCRREICVRVCVRALAYVEVQFSPNIIRESGKF